MWHLAFCVMLIFSYLPPSLPVFSFVYLTTCNKCHLTMARKIMKPWKRENHEQTVATNERNHKEKGYKISNLRLYRWSWLWRKRKFKINDYISVRILFKEAPLTFRVIMFMSNDLRSLWRCSSFAPNSHMDIFLALEIFGQKREGKE